jgi:hypothetical protein
MNAQLDERPIVAAIWIAADKEDWAGVNDCGAIYRPAAQPIESSGPIDPAEWPIESCG